MALIGNRSILHKSPGRFLSGTVASGDRSNLSKQGMIRNAYEQFNAKAALPDGAYSPVAWVQPITQGAMSSNLSGVLDLAASGAILAGYPIEGSTEISITVADAEGQLISSGEGSATLSITVADLLLTASLNAIGQAEISLTVADATLGAEASLTGSATFAVTGSLTPYAIGHMTGSALPYTELSPQSLADAVLDAAANSPIYANIKQVNDITVDGTGQTGDEWGPA